MNIACVIREQRRWGLNGLLTRPLNTGRRMERSRQKEAEKERGGTRALTDRERRRAKGGRKRNDGRMEKR